MNATMKSDTCATPNSSRRADFAVIGLGLSGQSVVRFLTQFGASVIVMDTREQPPALADIRARYPEVEVRTGPLDSVVLKHCDRVVVSPGVPLSDPVLRQAIASGKDVIGDIELFAQHALAPVIAITGTNGKSTVTTLVADMLEAAGLETRRGGNLGVPALDLLEHHEPDYYVLELSSFQLELTSALAPRVACVLNLSPDHLDRHGSFENYVSAKARILEHAQSAVLNADDPILRSYSCSGRRIEFSLSNPGPDRYGVVERDGQLILASASREFLAWESTALVGRHNLANALAAIAIADTCNIDKSAIVDVLQKFSGLAHRAEILGQSHGVRFVNDSKATNPGAAGASIAGLLEHGGVVIAGGQSKGGSFTDFADVVASYAHSVVLMGEAAAELESALGGRVDCMFADDMHSAVQAAAAAAKPGETVLLAPACASFDQFENYADRGDAFRRAVQALGALS